MNGKARRVGCEVERGICLHARRACGSLVRESTTSGGLDYRRFDFEPGGR